MSDEQRHSADEVVEVESKKVGILYICTGRYREFWPIFYHSFEENFLPNHEKHYFVFTDTPVEKFGNERVKCKKQAHKEWPSPTLDRFEMFLSIEEALKDMDYLFFLNSNLKCIQVVGDEILPSNPEQLVAPVHAQFFKWTEDGKSFTAAGGPLTQNPKSLAYFNDPKHDYVMGGFNGGCTEAVLAMYRQLRNDIETDKKNGVIAERHDESHLNHFMRRNIKKLTPAYMCPEFWLVPVNPKIICLDKDPHGGLTYFRTLADRVSPFVLRKRLEERKAFQQLQHMTAGYNARRTGMLETFMRKHGKAGPKIHDLDFIEIS